MDVPRLLTVPAWGGFPLSLVDGWARVVTVAAAQLPFRVNSKSRWWEGRKIAPVRLCINLWNPGGFSGLEKGLGRDRGLSQEAVAFALTL